eukprot:4853420-Amphidinium_carterae.1
MAGSKSRAYGVGARVRSGARCRACTGAVHAVGNCRDICSQQATEEVITLLANYAGARKDDLDKALRDAEAQLRAVSEHASAKPALYMAGSSTQRLAARREAIMRSIRSVAAFVVGAMEGFGI